MRKFKMWDGRHRETELSMQARRAAGGDVEVGIAARGWLAVFVVGLVLILLVVCIALVSRDGAATAAPTHAHPVVAVSATLD
jgi:hypothetical protein